MTALTKAVGQGVEKMDVPARTGSRESTTMISTRIDALERNRADELVFPVFALFMVGVFLYRLMI